MRFANEHGFCDLNEFPGCKWLVVSNHAYIYKEHRGRGEGTKNHLLRCKRAKEMGYNAIICTVRQDNAAEIAILRRNLWTKVWEFTSHDGGKVDIWCRDLNNKNNVGQTTETRKRA